MISDQNSSLKTIKIDITGHVQGVFYRASSRHEANRLNINGWVKNNPNGSVTVCAQGTISMLEKFLAWCHEGPEHAKVNSVSHSEIKNSVVFNSFEIKP